MKDMFGEGITFRHWLAWKLQRLAWYINRIHDGEYEERLSIYKGDQLMAEWIINADIWGHGASSQHLNPKFSNKYRVEWEHNR